MTFVVLILFVSGFSSLVYEILWTRHLTSVIGGSSYAVTLILTVFMGGLGLGSALGGKLADSLSTPAKLLRAYGILEIGVGLYALLLPTMLGRSQPIFAFIYGHFYNSPSFYHTLVFGLCGLLLLVPVLAMGATLPLLGRYSLHRSAAVGQSLSLLYVANTLGAVSGVVSTGFWLFPNLGLQATTWMAASLNGAIGILTLIRSRKWMIPSDKSDQYFEMAIKIKRSSLRIQEAVVEKTNWRMALFLFALSGYCAMAYEVSWTRVLTLVMGPTTFAFTLVLAIFITGLALGCLAFGRIADRALNPLWLLAVTQSMAAALGLAVSHFMGNSLYLFQKMDFHFQADFTTSLALKSLVLFVFMLPPTFFLGAAFPLTMRVVARPGSQIGRSVGIAYAINTLGGVLGAWSASMVWIPLWGHEHTLGALAGLQFLAAIVVITVALHGKNVLQWRWLVLVPTVIITLSLCWIYPHWDRPALARAGNRILEADPGALAWAKAFFGYHPAPTAILPEEQVFYGDGIGGFTSVWRSENLIGEPDYSLFVSGKADASSRLDMFTQVLLAQFPMLLHPHPKKVMVLGLASGVTAGEVLNYDMDRMDILEINPQVTTASDFFKAWNGSVLQDPRVHLIEQDAKAHLLLSQEKYDVLISEPSNPWLAGLSELFTRDFFERARNHLNEGGIAVEFLHSYQMDWNAFSMVGRTFAQVFPNSMLVRTMPDDRRLPGSASDYLLVGIKGSQRISFENSLEKQKALSRSKNLKLADPRLLYRLIESEDLAALFGAGPIHTDNLPLLEFAAPKLRFTFDSHAIEVKIAAGSVLSSETRKLRDSLRADPESRLGFAEYALSLSKPFPGMVNQSHATPTQQERYSASIENYCQKTHITDWEFLDDTVLKTRCAVNQMASLNRKLKASGSPAVTLAMAEVCLANGVPANAYQFYSQALNGAGEYSLVGREARSRMDEIRRQPGLGLENN